MKRPILRLAAICSLAFTLNSFATVHYVDLNCANPTSPYSGWSTAATNIQDAVDASTNGDTVLVTNGIYQTGERVVYEYAPTRVVVDKAVTVQSVNGPEVTLIKGCPLTGEWGFSARCGYLTNNAVLLGFTLTNGGASDRGDWRREASGAGVWCESTSAVISNCVIINNYVYAYGGGAYGGTLINCTITGNSGTEGYLGNLTNCIVGNCGSA